MRRIIIQLWLVLALVGCQDLLSLQKAENSFEMAVTATKSNADNFTTDKMNERVVYLAEKDFKTWVGIVGLENRFLASDVSKSTAEAMTTEALVESLVHYPLNYILFAYNDPDKAIETIIDNSTLHRELLTRADAAELIIDKYVNARPVKSRNMVSSETNQVMIEDDVFLGEFIIANNLLDQVEQSKLDSLGKKLEKKCELILNTLDSFKEVLLVPITRMAETAGLSVNGLSRGGGTFLGNYQIRTPLFQPLDGTLLSEWSDDFIAYYDSVYVTNHPGAILRGHTSHRYNCHSFAWYQNSTSNQVWLNSFSPLTYSFQLGKYWTADLYEATTSTYGEKVFYPNGDHSAIKLANGNFLSKWGAYPLMEHAYNDCPYLSTNLQYYKEKNLPLNNAPNITGPTYVAPNVANNYIIPQSVNSYIHYYVTAEGLNPEWTYTLTQIGTDTYSLVCNDYGAYNIEVDGYAYYNGMSYYYSNNTLLVLCVGNRTMHRIIEENVIDIKQFLADNQDHLSE